MPKLKIERLPGNDAGRLLVRLNEDHRNGIKRYGIGKLTNTDNEKSTLALFLGHDRDDAIFMPYDLRTSLGAAKGEKLSFRVESVNWFGKIRWYLSSRDPAVHLPAWIAVIGIAVGILGVIVSLF